MAFNIFSGVTSFALMLMTSSHRAIRFLADLDENFALIQSGYISKDENGNTIIGGETNYLMVDPDGHITFHGTARPWRDEVGDILTLKTTGAGVSFNATESVLEFTTGANLNDYAYRNVQLNHDRDESVAIKPHIHFFQALNAVPNFLIQYRWQINGLAKVTSWENLKCNTLAIPYVSGTILNIVSCQINVPANSSLSDILQIRILRDNTNASGAFTGSDPYGATVGILSFDIHIQSNSFGSDDEYEK